jgi:hypothetical protein
MERCIGVAALAMLRCISYLARIFATEHGRMQSSQGRVHTGEWQAVALSFAYFSACWPRIT